LLMFCNCDHLMKKKTKAKTTKIHAMNNYRLYNPCLSLFVVCLFFFSFLLMIILFLLFWFFDDKNKRKIIKKWRVSQILQEEKKRNRFKEEPTEFI
jgi:hypothetical protein